MSSIFTEIQRQQVLQISEEMKFCLHCKSYHLQAERPVAKSGTAKVIGKVCADCTEELSKG